MDKSGLEIVTITPEELCDVNQFIYQKLREQFGKTVDADWCMQFSDSIFEEFDRVRKDHNFKYYQARNKMLFEHTMKNS